MSVRHNENTSNYLCDSLTDVFLPTNPFLKSIARQQQSCSEDTPVIATQSMV